MSSWMLDERVSIVVWPDTWVAIGRSPGPQGVPSLGSGIRKPRRCAQCPRHRRANQRRRSMSPTYPPAARYTWSGVLCLVGGALAMDVAILLVIPAVLFAGHLAGSRTSLLAGIATVLCFVPMLGSVVLLAFDALVFEASTQADRAAAADLVEAFQTDAFVIGVTGVYLLTHVVGFLLLGLCLWRARRSRPGPRWPWPPGRSSRWPGTAPGPRSSPRSVTDSSSSGTPRARPPWSARGGWPFSPLRVVTLRWRGREGPSSGESHRGASRSGRIHDHGAGAPRGRPRGHRPRARR